VADWPRTGAERGDQFGGYGHRDAEPRGLARTDRDTGEADLFAPTADELARWEAPPVREFRRKFGWYAIIGSVLLLVSLLGDRDFFGAFALWTVYIAYRYAKLWSDGFDWHDAMRQSRERLFADVVAEWGDDLQAVFDPAKRAKVRERQRRRRMRRAAWDQAAYPGTPAIGAPPLGAPALSGPALGGSLGAPAPTGRTAAVTSPEAYAGRGAPGGAPPAAPAFADVTRQAVADRDEIVRLLGTMPKGERERMGDVAGSARALSEKVQVLAATVAQLDQDAAPGASAVLEAEITRLEGEANPLDLAASDGRVKRLAYLKRQRRAMADVARRREAAATALDHCRIALQTMRVDLVRLRTGTASPAQVTTLAERAMVLAREVDGIIGAAGDVARATSPGTASETGATGPGTSAARAGAR
jgi:serine/threonine-protein kinase